MAETTLTQMARGGMFDQIGGGFSRYSTDGRWLVPHFEKMLYDNALLTLAYLEGYNSTGNPFYAQIARRTMDYVLRELRDPAGGFYCGQDADSDGEEGKFYLFTPEEIAAILPREEADAFCQFYSITLQGNFEGKSIPNLLCNPDYGQIPSHIQAQWEKLIRFRRERCSLHLDDKVLVSWNGLMIGALAWGCRVLGEERYGEAAYQAWNFIKEHLLTSDGRLFLRWREGERAHEGQLDDYAFLIWGLLELYPVRFDSGCLRWAARLAEQMWAHFSDEREEGLFLTADDAPQLIVRPKESYDGAIPAGNSVAGKVLLALWRLTGETKWREWTQRQAEFLAGAVQEAPAGHCFGLMTLLDLLSPSCELVCVSAEETPPKGLEPLLRKYKLNTLFKTSQNAEELCKVAPFTESYPIPDKGYAYYLCREGACASPVFTLEELKDLF